MLINHISVSRSDCFKECDAKYRFRYHLKVASPEPTPFYFTYGKIIHKIIENYTLGRGEKNINVARDEVLSGKVEIQEGERAPAIPFDYRRRIPVNLSNFMKLCGQIGTDGDVEYLFKYDLDPPHGRFCTGLIDRIIRKDDKVFIIDYKTTKEGPFRKNEWNITSDLQLQCYCWVVMKEFGIPAGNIKAALYYLEDGKLLGVRFSEKTLATVPEKLLNIYKSIEAADPDKVKGNVGNWCGRCDYRSLCPFYRAEKKR